MSVSPAEQESTRFDASFNETPRRVIFEFGNEVELQPHSEDSIPLDTVQTTPELKGSSRRFQPKEIQDSELASLVSAMGNVTNIAIAHRHTAETAGSFDDPELDAAQSALIAATQSTVSSRGKKEARALLNQAAKEVLAKARNHVQTDGDLNRIRGVLRASVLPVFRPRKKSKPKRAL